MHTTVYITQITNKDLVYSTENSTQYSVIIDTGKKSREKRWIYVCMYIYIKLIHCTYTPETNVSCKSAMLQ